MIRGLVLHRGEPRVWRALSFKIDIEASMYTHRTNLKLRRWPLISLPLASRQHLAAFLQL